MLITVSSYTPICDTDMVDEVAPLLHKYVTGAGFVPSIMTVSLEHTVISGPNWLVGDCATLLFIESYPTQPFMSVVVTKIVSESDKESVA